MKQCKSILKHGPSTPMPSTTTEFYDDPMEHSGSPAPSTSPAPTMGPKISPTYTTVSNGSSSRTYADFHCDTVTI